ncbi:MAG TPA: hypothetical protein DDY37_07960 [Legionella sp.]|nr:hypothetical protein [Legionella sp.]
MAELPDDLSQLNEPRTYREMFQRIMWLMEKERDDRQDDRELLESFITNQKKINDELTGKISNLEAVDAVQNEAILTLKKRVDSWNVLNSIGVVIASILAALGLKGS